jgi:hypothetical protein
MSFSYLKLPVNFEQKNPQKNKISYPQPHLRTRKCPMKFLETNRYYPEDSERMDANGEGKEFLQNDPCVAKAMQDRWTAE